MNVCRLPPAVRADEERFRRLVEASTDLLTRVSHPPGDRRGGRALRAAKLTTITQTAPPSGEALLAEADAAMYQAKARGRDAFVVHDSAISRSAHHAQAAGGSAGAGRKRVRRHGRHRDPPVIVVPGLICTSACARIFRT